MAGSNINFTSIRGMNDRFIRVSESRGEKELRHLEISDPPKPGDWARLAAFVNGRKCNCAKNRTRT
jgi:hypothetical protein